MPKYKHGAGSVYRRGKTYWISYYLKGKRIRESTETNDKTEARRILQTRIGQIADGKFVGPVADRVTFQDLVALIEHDYKINNRLSFDKVEQKIRLYLQPFFGHMKPKEITLADIKAFIAKRKTEITYRGTPTTNGEINRELAVLKRMFNLAIHESKLTTKPYIPRLEEDPPRQGFFESHDFESVLPHLADCLKAPFTFCYRLGWRARKEVFRLTWPQVDLQEGTVRLEVGTTKNKGGREIYLPEDLKLMLYNLYQEHRAQYADCALVFHDNGKPIANYYKRWSRACQAANLSSKIPHDFRRTAVRNMVRSGIPERVAMMISGHKTRSVFDRYHIVSPSDLKEAAQRLSNGHMPSQMGTNLGTIASEPVSESSVSTRKS